MGDWFQQTALSGSLLLALPVALVAGLVSFFSPCVIPLLPGYLSYATGLSGADLATGEVRRGRMLAGAVLFVLGFSVVFVSLGVAVRERGPVLHHQRAHLRGRARRRSRSCSAWRSWGWCRGCSATCACTGSRSSGWPPRRSWGSCSGWAGRRASGRPSRVIITLAYNEATACARRAAARLLRPRPRPPVHPRRTGVAPALGAFAWVRRHQVWVMRAGGPVARRRRRAAAHRLVGPRPSPGSRSTSSATSR